MSGEKGKTLARSDGRPIAQPIRPIPAADTQGVGAALRNRAVVMGNVIQPRAKAYAVPTPSKGRRGMIRQRHRHIRTLDDLGNVIGADDVQHARHGF